MSLFGIKWNRGLGDALKGGLVGGPFGYIAGLATGAFKNKDGIGLSEARDRAIMDRLWAAEQMGAQQQQLADARWQQGLQQNAAFDPARSIMAASYGDLYKPNMDAVFGQNPYANVSPIDMTKAPSYQRTKGGK